MQLHKDDSSLVDVRVFTFPFSRYFFVVFFVLLDVLCDHHPLQHAVGGLDWDDADRLDWADVDRLNWNAVSGLDWADVDQLN